VLSRLLIDVFAEDRAHEAFVTAMIARVAADLGARVSISVISARGGHGRALKELQLFKLMLAKGLRSRPDMIVAVVDGNCVGHVTRKREVEEILGDELGSIAAIGCPDPHIERWYLNDPTAFHGVLGREPIPVRYKCERDRYKKILTDSIIRSGNDVLLGGLEYARELIDVMDLYAAGRVDNSFGVFHEALRAGIQTRLHASI
jgi:hypothetical protein